MNKTYCTGLFLAISMLATTGYAQNISAADLPTKNFSYVGAWSNVLLYKKYEEPFWSTHVKEASDGKITAKVTSFDQLGIQGDQVFRLLEKGVFDVGTTLPDYVIQDVPAMGGVDIPVLISDAKTATEAAYAFKSVLADLMREKYNAELLAVAPNSKQALYCKKPLSGLKDLKGRKVRAGGRYEAIFLNAVGAEGVTMSFSEVPGAMQNGLIDCAITGLIGGYNAGWYDISDYVYTLAIGGWDHAATAVNGKVWDSLPENLQVWLKQQAHEYFEVPSWDDAEEITDQAINCLTGRGECIHGAPGHMTLVEPTEEDLELAKTILTEHVLPEWAKATEPKWVERWNETIGKIAGVQAAAK